MHYMTGVILPFRYEGEKLDEALAAILAPWDENKDTEDGGMNPDGQWDWYQLGGRYSGAWTEYDPTKDPKNIDFENRFGDGVKWPTRWDRAEQHNVVPVSYLLKRMEETGADSPSFALCAAPDIWISREAWNGSTFVEHPDWPSASRSFLVERSECWIACVDIHS